MPLPKAMQRAALVPRRGQSRESERGQEPDDDGARTDYVFHGKKSGLDPHPARRQDRRARPAHRSSRPTTIKKPAQSATRTSSGISALRAAAAAGSGRAPARTPDACFRSHVAEPGAVSPSMFAGSSTARSGCAASSCCRSCACSTSAMNNTSVILLFEVGGQALAVPRRRADRELAVRAQTRTTSRSC